MDYPTEMQQKMDAMYGENKVKGGSINPRVLPDVMNAMPQRDKAPVEVSMARLFERIGQLQAETDQLTDRLMPVSFIESTAGNACSDRPKSACQMVEALDQACERIEATMARISDARARLCI